MQLHFISGLPRSGSTLLSAILKQNPKFHTGVTTPLKMLVDSAHHLMGSGNEHSGNLTDKNRKDIIKGIFESFYNEVTTQHGRNIVIFDTNRAWSSSINILKDLFPECKVLCCVRPIDHIVESIESIVAKNAFFANSIFDLQKGMNIYTRTEFLMSSTGLVGAPLNCLKQGCFGSESERIAIVPYDQLAKNPKYIIDEIYKFIGEEKYIHDFENLQYENEIYDSRLGLRELHKVRKKVEYIEPILNIPPDLIEKLQNFDFWNYPLSGKYTVLKAAS